MTKKLKRPIAFLASAAMMFSMLLYLPSGAPTDHGFGLTVSAEDSTDADDTSTNGGTGDSTPTDTNGGTGDTNATANPNANGANNEEDTTNDNAAVLLTASAETAHTHAPCGKESCGYYDHSSITYTPFSDAAFECNLETEERFEKGAATLDLSEYDFVVLTGYNYDHSFPLRCKAQKGDET
ncbi:MAG: hypothetical protein ACI4J7_02525, partial [Ruminiclostridium sp.]